jgi:hypothetical protein
MVPETAARRIHYIDRWLFAYTAWWVTRRVRPPRHLWVAIADHYEPLWNRADLETARGRVAKWRERWPEIAARHVDSNGASPVYTFFYPQEEYRHDLVEPLAEITRLGFGDVEVHIHHDGEGQEHFVSKMQSFLETLHTEHGLLRRHEGKISFGFIHGNWAIDNSRPDGKWCGLNNEVRILRDLGCYADFTMPAPDSPCQGGPVNTIFRVEDDPLRPRSHTRGVPLRVGGVLSGDLTFIPGPLALDFSSRGVLRPRIECGEIAGNRPPSMGRAHLWLRLAPRLGEHAFLKLFTHGAQEQNMDPMLGGDLDKLFDCVSTACAALGARLHYVSAWGMWKAVDAVRCGMNPVDPAAGSGT